MSGPRRIAINSAYLLAANVVSILIRFIYMMLIYRFLDTELEGQYIIASNWGSILALNLHAGMVYILIREIAVKKERTAELVGDGIVISCILFVVVMLLAIISAALLIYVKHDPPLVGLGIIAFTFSLSITYIPAVYGAGFKAHEKLLFDAIILVFQAVLSLGLIWYYCREPYTLLDIFLVIGFVSIVTTVFSAIMGSAVLGKPVIRWNPAALKYLAVESSPAGVAEAVRINYMRAGNFALWIFHQFGSVSSFGIPYQITEQLKVIPASIRPAIFPAMCRLAKGNQKGFEWIYNFLMRVLVVIALPLGLMFMAASGLILMVYMKDPSLEAISALRVLSLIIVISFPSLVVRNIFIALGKQKLDTVISFAALGMLLILLIALVPKHEVYGAVAAAFISEVFLFAIGIFFIYRLGFRLDFIGTFLKPALCTAPLILAMIYTPREGFIGMRLGIYCVCIALYIALIFITKTLSKSDIENLRRVTRSEDPVWGNCFM